MDIDEDAVLKLYGLSTLDPFKWEDVQRAPEDDTATALELLGDASASQSLPTGNSSVRREIDDPLGLRPSLPIPKDMPMNTLAPTLLSSKAFVPSQFLGVHHPDASVQELQRGVDNLRRGVEDRGEEVRLLVEREFGRFVSVKNSGDSVYKDMKYEFLADGSDHGTREVREIVKVTSHRAETIFLPLLSNALKAQKLRSTLGVFERSKFLFGLPRTLRIHVNSGKYDLALRDYNKGLYLLRSRPNQLLPVTYGTGTGGTSVGTLGGMIGSGNIPGQQPGKNSISSASIRSDVSGPAPSTINGIAPGLTDAQTQARTDQQQRIFSKIWTEVDKVMSEMRTKLEEELREGAGGDRTVEEVEKRIEMLLELDADGEVGLPLGGGKGKGKAKAGGKEDPAWLYFDAQHEYITSRLRTVFTAQMKNLENVKREAATHKLDEKATSNNLLKCIERLSNDGGEGLISHSAGCEVWEATYDVVHGLSQVLEENLSSFWRVCRGYIEGKYRSKREGTSSSSRSRPPSQCRSMAVEIIKLYISLIARLFALSDVSIAVKAAKPGADASGPPAFVPLDSNSITTCHFVSRLLAEIMECVTEVEVVAVAVTETEKGQSAGGVGQDAKKALKGLVESCRWRFEEAICETWSRDAKSFFRLEAWEMEVIQGQTTTVYLQHMRALQRHNATIGWQVAGGSQEQGPNQAEVPEAFVNKLKNTFFDTLYYLLDGLVHLAFSDPSETGITNIAPPEASTTFDVCNRDHRVLVTISNLSHLKNTVLPKTLQRFEAMCKIACRADRQTLDQIVQQLDGILFDDFVKRKVGSLDVAVQDGLLGDGTAWAEGGKPTEVRSYMFTALLRLVEVHNQVNGIAPTLVKRVVEILTEELAKSMLECFKQIHRLAIGGMLSATLEVEFLHQTLLQYVTPEATSYLNDIYATISQAYTNKSDGDDLQHELEDLKRILVDSRRATGVGFICFKPSKQ